MIKKILVIAYFIVMLGTIVVCLYIDRDNDTYNDVKNSQLPVCYMVFNRMDGWINNSTNEIEVLRFYIDTDWYGAGPDPTNESFDIEQGLEIFLEYSYKEFSDFKFTIVNLIHQNNSIINNETYERFNHRIIEDPHDSMELEGLLDMDSSITIEIDLSVFENSPPEGNGLNPSSECTIKLFFPNGNQSPIIEVFSAPDIFPGDEGWIELVYNEYVYLNANALKSKT